MVGDFLRNNPEINEEKIDKIAENLKLKIDEIITERQNIWVSEKLKQPILIETV